MNIKVKGTDIEVTEAIRDYAEKKIGETLKKFNSSSKGNILVEIELGKTNNHHTHGDNYKTSVTITGLSKNIFVDVVKDDLYASIDEAKDKLENRLAETKDKKKTLSNKISLKFKNLFKGND
ncbi:MAG: ribosome-associated translation inhibitor RaiA [Candidatus Nomurabacteria bacterium]